jgi:threonine dehydratase
MLKPSTSSWGRENRLGSSLREVSLLWQSELFANSNLTDVPNHADVQQAASRIRPYVRKTPMLQLEVEGRTVWLKLENTQTTGSFKVRGAFNALLSMPSRPSVVVTASGGNHGLGVAEAARRLEVEARIFVPKSIPEEKIRRLEAAGAKVERHGDHYAQAEAQARIEAERNQIPFIHPFAAPEVIAGQGTLGLEILEQTHGACDAVILAVGGGGLLSGVSIALGGSGIRVVGVEPTGIPTVHQALVQGRPVDVPIDSVTRSALGASRTTDLNLAIIQRLAEGIVLVPDDAILAARQQLWDLARQWVEPAAAVALAALVSGGVKAREPCVVVCGGNTAEPSASS